MTFRWLSGVTLRPSKGTAPPVGLYLDGSATITDVTSERQGPTGAAGRGGSSRKAAAPSTSTDTTARRRARTRCRERVGAAPPSTAATPSGAAPPTSSTAPSSKRTSWPDGTPPAVAWLPASVDPSRPPGMSRYFFGHFGGKGRAVPKPILRPKPALSVRVEQSGRNQQKGKGRSARRVQVRLAREQAYLITCRTR